MAEEAISPDPSPEKFEVDRAVADANYLVHNHVGVQNSIGAMLTARRLYAVALQELQTNLKTAFVPDPAILRSSHFPGPLVTEVLVQSVSNKGAKPFELVTLLETLVATLEYLKKVTEKNVKLEAGEHNEEMLDVDRARMASPVPFGIPAASGEPCTPRGKATVLVGYGPAVQYLLGWALNNVLMATDAPSPSKLFTAIRLLDETKLVSGHAQLVNIGKSDWVRCAKNASTLGRFVRDLILPQLSAPPDFLVVDDLAAASDGIIIQRDAVGFAPFRCADAHRVLIKWCENFGMAMLAGVPTITDAPVSVAGPEWEQLRAHAVVRPVAVIRKADDLELGKVKLVVGRDAFSLTINAGLIEPTSKIITS